MHLRLLGFSARLHWMNVGRIAWTKFLKFTILVHNVFLLLTDTIETSGFV